MANNGDFTELYRKHRPTMFKGVLGHDKEVAALNIMVKNDTVPHAMMFIGPSGTGKSTLAFILKNKLGCSDDDFDERDCGAEENPLDMIRQIKNRVGLAPMFGKCRIWLLEEFQAFSRARFAQEALLGLLEKTPTHVYFFLATTNPDKIIPAIRTRCTKVVLSALSKKDLEKIIAEVCALEKLNIGNDVKSALAEHAEGSARTALVLLHQVAGLKYEEEQLELIQRSDHKRQAIDLCRLLMQKAKWPEIAKMLESIEADPEELRHAVLGYAAAVLRKGKPSQKAYTIITAFESPFYDSGLAGLVRACYEVAVQS